MTAASKKTLSYLLKATILVLAALFIYNKVIGKNESIRQFELLTSAINPAHVVYTLASIVFLMAANWFLESLKWQYLAKKLTPISVWTAIEAVFCGLTWAIFTPNRIGEYGGRVMFLPNRKRIHGVFAMAVGAFAQNVVTNLTGILASLWFIYYFLDVSIWLYAGCIVISVIVLAFFFIFYFDIKLLVGLLDRVSFLKKYHRFFEIMGRYRLNELLTVLGYSFARFFVFCTQYYLIINLLVPNLPFVEMMLILWVFLFVQSAMPSLDLLDIGVRSFTAMHLFVFITNQQIAIIAAVSLIWLINLIIPAIIGSVFVFKMKFFDRTV